jgi:hypothetical protein
MQMPENVCSICNRPFTGFGNNAQPVAGGRCCYECTTYVVIPEKIRLMRKEQQMEKGAEPND